MDTSGDKARAGQAGRLTALIQATEERGLLGSKDRQIGGRFSAALIDEAQRVSGINENTELVTDALVRVALEDDFGGRLLAHKGRIPKATLFAG